jgi:hypothetical protein
MVEFGHAGRGTRTGFRGRADDLKKFSWGKRVSEPELPHNPMPIVLSASLELP